MENINKNPIDTPDITGDLNKLNQVVDQPDFSSSVPKEKQWGIPTTEEIVSNGGGQLPQTQPKKDPFLATIEEAGMDASTNAVYRAGRDLSKYKDYVSNTGFAISTPDDLLDSERALNQSNWEQAGNALLRVAGNILPEIGQQVSRMVDWSGDFSQDNVATQAFQEWKDVVTEGTPIYRENPEESFAFGDFAYWMDQGSNIATSALAFAAIGYATGGIAGAGLGTLGSAGARIMPNALRTATGARIAGYVQNAGSAVLTSKALTHAESVGVSIDTYNESYEKEFQAEKSKQKETGKTDEEITLSAKTKASQAAAFAYNMNQVNFYLNLTSAFKFNALGRVGSRGMLATDGIGSTALNTSKQTLKQQLLKDGAGLALEAGQEYVEETINFVAQKRGVDGGATDSYSEIIRKGLQDAISTEGLEAGFWGAIGGIAQTGATSAGKYVPMYKNKAYEESYAATRGRLVQERLEGKNNLTKEEINSEANSTAEREAGKVNKRVSKAFLESFREQKMIDARNEILEQFSMTPSENGTTANFTSDSGKKIKDTTNLLDTLEEQGRLFDEYDQALASNDIKRADQIRDKFTTRQMIDAIEGGTANTLERVYQGIANLTSDEAVEYGLSESNTDISYKTNAKDAISKLRKLENQSIRNNKYLNKDVVNEVDADLISLSDGYKKILKDKLGKITPDMTHAGIAGVVNTYQDTLNRYNSLSEEGDNPAAIEEIEKLQKSLEEQEEVYKDILSYEERRQRKDILSELSSLSNSINSIKEYRKSLVSKETQTAIRDILAAAEDSKVTMASNINDSNKQEKKKDDNKTNKQSKNPADTAPKPDTPVQAPIVPPTQATPVTVPPASTESTEESVQQPSITENANQVDYSNAYSYNKPDWSKYYIEEEYKGVGSISYKLIRDGMLIQSFDSIDTAYLELQKRRNIERGNNTSEIIDIAQATPVVDNTPSVNAYDLQSNPFFSALVEKLGENNPFVVAYTNFITQQLDTLKQRQDGTNIFELIDKIVFTFNDNIVDSLVKQEVFFQKFPAIQAKADSDASVMSTINNFFRTEAERFQSIKNSMENLNGAISDLAGLDSAPTSTLTEDEKSEAFDNEEMFDDDEIFDIDQHIQNNNTSPLDFKNTAQIAVTVSNILSELSDNGIPITTWDDFYIQLVNASSKDVINSILPRIKNVWEFIVKDNVLSGNVLSANDYQIDETVSHLDDLAEQAQFDEGWDSSKDNGLVNQMGTVINNIAQSTPTNTPILVESGSGLKSNTVFKLAYAAREYVVKTVMKDGVRIDTKEDFDDSLNNNNDYELFDTANLVPGSELVLIPLNIGEVYRYIHPRENKWYSFRRVSVDKVARSIDNGPEDLLDAVDHMPIFISKSTNRKDIIDGTFLHLPEWASTDNMTGDEVDVKLQQQMIRDFRNLVVNNVNKKGGNKKLVRIKIQDKTAGIPITSPGRENVKANTRITENINLAISNRGNLLTAQGETAGNINKEANSLPNSTLFVMLPTPAGEIAYPLRRTTFKNTDLKESVMSVLDLLFTRAENLSDQQRKDIDTFKRLGLDVRSYKSVKRYLNDILYTGHLREADANNKKLFYDALDVRESNYLGKPLFRFAVSDTPYLQFGRLGTQGSELSFETYEQNREGIRELLSTTLDNTYVNASLDSINSKKKVLGIKDGIPSILYNSYNDMLKDTSLTNLSPKTITNPKTGKDKVIYTFQQTISFEPPITNVVSSEGEVTSVQPVQEEEIVQPVVDEFAEEEDFYDTEDDEGYSFDTEADDSSFAFEDGYTFEEAIAPYTYIPGLSNMIQNSVVFQAINNIYSSITEEGTPKGIEASVNETLLQISEFYNGKIDFTNRKIDAGKFESDEARDKAITDNETLLNRIQLLIENKQKLIDRVNLVIKQEGLSVSLTGKAKKKYLQKIAKQKVINEDERQAEDLGLAPILNSAEKESLLELGEVNEVDLSDDVVDDSEEETEELSFDKDAMTINPSSSLTQELKQFFNSIKQTRYVIDPKTNTGKYVQPKNFLGLNNTIPFNTVFQKVQELLAQYPTEDYKTPSIERFIQILEDNQRKAPYLLDVVERLKSPNTTEDFKNAFVLGMYKMYNNTIFTNITYSTNEEAEQAFYTSAITNVTSNNVVSLLVNKWNEELESQGLFEESTNDQGRTVRTMSPETVSRLRNLYNGIKGSKESMKDFVKLFKSIGIEFPNQMLMDLGNKILKIGDTYYGLNSFMDTDIVKYSVESIIGNAFSGTPAIGDINTEEVYGNHAFLKLARLIATYEDNLTSNSSRNLNGDMIFNITEVKNVVESFFSAQNIDNLKRQMSDPYHNFVYNSTKRYKSWRESLVTKAGDSFILNKDSNFAKSFRYYTLSGQKVKDESGSTVLEVEKMSENDHILDHLLMFMNKGRSIGSGNGREAMAIYPYLTMSDKKVPIAFSAPSIRFVTELFDTRLDTIPTEYKDIAQQQIDYLYEVMLLPDIRRMIYMDKNPSINIKEYSQENAKFYTMPALNLIDFDYVDGDINNEKDGGVEIRERLGLKPDQNLFEFRGTGSNTERVINTEVLQKPEVIAFLKNRMLNLFHQEAGANLRQMVDAGIINTVESGGYQFNDGSKFDFDSYSKLGYNKGSAIDMQSFIINYTVNKMISYAQMQDLLIGDPIQYAKPSSDTKGIKKELKDITVQRVELSLSLDEGLITEEDANAIREDLSRKENDARYRLISATQQDILSANDNQGKRLAADNASGQLPVYAKDNQTYNMLVMSDVNIGVADRDFYAKYLVPLAIQNMPDSVEKTNTINKILEKYLEIDQADAQEFTTLDEHLDTMVALQEISREEADTIRKDDEAGRLKPEDYSNVLQSMKMVYAERFDRNNINSKLYVKSSSFPLSKTFVKGLPIEDLYNHMITNKIHRATFKTAVKVGSPIQTAPVFNTDGTVNKEVLRNTEASVVRDIPRAGHKKQQNVPYKEDKTQLNDGTQKAKLTFVNLMDTPGFKFDGKTIDGRTLHDEYINTYREMYRLRHEELKNELYPNGINAGVHYPTLHKLILGEAQSRGYSENDIAFLALNDENTNFLFPLWLSGNEKKLASLLNSIVDNRVRKRKREGISGVLVSDIAIATNPEYKSNITYTTMDRGNQLRSMRDVNGDIVEAEVIVPFRFRDNKGKLLNMKDFTKKDADGNTLIDTDKIPSEILDIIGFRIPTQGLNSMLAIKIVGFLPEGYQNVVIAPVDVVAQMGSDFDVDKMFQDFINTTYEDGKLRRLNQSDLDMYNKGQGYRKTLRQVKDAKRNQDDVRVGILSKSLQEQRGLLEQQDFLDMTGNVPSDIQMKLLEDKIFDIQKAVLMNPHADVQTQRVQPIDSATFVNITKKIMPEVYDSTLPANWSPYTTLYQIRKYLNARGGKVGVSTWSSTSVLNAVLQGIDFKTLPMYLQQYDRESKSYTPLEYTFLGQKSTLINNPKGAKGHFKSDIIQALQSITVDNENLQIMHKLNLNEFTNDFIRAAVLMGYDETSIFYFINHPVVKEIVKGKTNKTTIRRPNKYYIIKDANGIEQQIDYTQSNMFGMISRMSLEQLQEDIKNNSFDETSPNHYAIYSFFMELTNHGKTFKSLESLLNVDSKGIGSNLFYSLEKEYALLNLKDNTQISNINKVLGDFAPTFAQDTELEDVNSDEYKKARGEYNQDLRSRGYVELQNSWFLPKTIPSMAAGFALVTNNRLWSKTFPYHSNTFDYTTRVGLQLENNKANDQYFSVTSANKSGESFINNDVEADAIGTASPTKDSEIKSNVVEHMKSFLYSTVRKDMNMTEAELVDGLTDMQDSFPNNLFLKKLSVERVGVDGKLIVFDSGSKDSSIDNNLVNDIIELLVSLNPDAVNYIKQLILQQLANGGIQKAKQFVKHIPPHYLGFLGVYNDINNKLNEFDQEAFITQYIQHNPHFVASKELWDQYRRGNVKMSQESIILDNVDTSDDIIRNIRYSYISMLQSNGKYMLFKRNANNPAMFTAIPTLGRGGIREYSLDREVATSQFDDNNPQEGWYFNSQEVESIGDQYGAIRSVINQKLSLGITTPEDTEAIVKVCK